ncbi:MAG: hypothetical protein D3903_20865 [Candidatus Electrothrix sp. GM3_4]|nr:hypothetical protein [Candidatus Electrothrix sp. GM3_4]
MISFFRFLGIRCQFGCFDFSCFLMIRLISFSFIKPLFWYQAVFADLCTIIEAFCILTNCINSFTWYFFQHPSYIQLKFEECRLLYEYKLKKAAQDEEQRLIREQIREEARLTKEYEKAISEANREEKLFKTLLEKVQEQLDKAHEGEKDELQGKIMLLETQLQEAEEMTQRAKSMAEQTRKGHVYIVSNIGSFGDEIYKIGLTRRLDPQERVKELGGASVPFAFDVHAMIYSDDAPALESALHKRFDQVRVNAINRRKEFFKVSLEEIKSATKEIAAHIERVVFFEK